MLEIKYVRLWLPPKREKMACQRSMTKKNEKKKKKVVAMSEKNIICQGMIKERGNQHFKE